MEYIINDLMQNSAVKFGVDALLFEGVVFAVLGWGAAEVAGKGAAHVSGGGEAGAFGDVLHGEIIRINQQAPGVFNAASAQLFGDGSADMF